MIWFFIVFLVTASLTKAECPTNSSNFEGLNGNPSNGGEKKYDYFISYKRADGKALAGWIYEKLLLNNVTAFLDVREMPDICKWPDALDKAIVNSKYFLAIITKEYTKAMKAKGTPIYNEITYALKNQKLAANVFEERVDFPDKLPSQIQPLTLCQGHPWDYRYPDFVTQKLIKCARNPTECPKVMTQLKY